MWLGCLLCIFPIYCYCIRSLQIKLRISSCIAEMQVFASTRDFFKSLFPGFSQDRQILRHRFSVPQFRDFCPRTQLPDPCSAFAVPGKPFWLIRGVEQALNIACRSRALDRCSAMVCCRLSGPFSFVEEALIGNPIFSTLENSLRWTHCFDCISARSDHLQQEDYTL